MNRSEQSYAPIHINRHRMRSALELCHRLIGICQVDKSERSGSSVAGLILLSGVVVLAALLFVGARRSSQPPLPLDLQGVERETRSDRPGRTGDWLSRQLARRPSTSGTPALQHPVHMS